MRSNKITTGKAIGIATLGIVMSGFVLGIALAGGFDSNQKPFVEAYNQKNLIRFHVIANSDSIRDQALKRKVRDLVVQTMTPKLSTVDNVEEARRVTLDNMEQIETITLEEVHKWGESYGVKATLGRFTFPAKTYGNITLPAGEYEAVRIVLGEGAGQNWWCVLFPPLCFLDGTKGVPEVTPSPEVGPRVEETYSPEREYIVPGTQYLERDREIHVKFKIFELLDKWTS